MTRKNLVAHLGNEETKRDIESSLAELELRCRNHTIPKDVKDRWVQILTKKLEGLSEDEGEEIVQD